jgi:hypothetical protein
MKTRLPSVIIGLLFASALPKIVQAQTATLRLDSVWGCPGEVLEMPVRVSGVSELGLDAFTFYFQIDTAIIEPILLSWDSDRGMGMPLFSGWNEEFMERGMYATNYFFEGWQTARPTIAITWLDRAFDQPKLKPVDGSILFKLNFRIKKTPTTSSAVTITVCNMAYDAVANKNYIVNLSEISGHILAKTSPQVKIEDKNFDGIVDARLCFDQNLPLKASGAERYEWELYPTATHHYGWQNEAQSISTIFDRTDVFNPLFTPIPPGQTGRYNYKFLVKGYSGDGCMGVDSIYVFVQPNRRFVTQPQDYHFVNRGEVLDLELLFSASDAYSEVFMPYTYRWFPEEKVENARIAQTKTLPINEPTWFWGQVTDRSGCMQTINIKVDMREEMLFGRLEKSANEFCGENGITQHQVTLAALVEGGSDEKSYEWAFRKFYDGREPEFSNVNINSIDLTFFGTTEITVRITDLETLDEQILTETVFVDTKTSLSIRIDMDEASKEQYDIGYCVDMPITFEATVENAGDDYQIYWEIDGTRTRGFEGNKVTFPGAGHQNKFRAVLHSTAKCLEKSYAFSNEIDPKSEYYQITGIFIDSIRKPISNCNSDSVLLLVHAHNIGTEPFFQIYRNDELIREFTYYGNNPDLVIPVKSENYWDRFSVRFTNTSCKCLSINNRVSNYAIPKLGTNDRLKTLKIVSDLGGDTVCNSSEGIYTFRLTGMEQFGQNTTVIWMLNDKEWGRYEFDPTVSNALPFPPEKHGGDFVINQNLDQDELAVFIEKYAFGINAENFPKVGTTFNPGDSLWAILISEVECGSGSGTVVIEHVPAIIPKFAPLEDAALTVVPNAGLNVCKGGSLTFNATTEKVGQPSINWYLNNQNVYTGSSFTMKNPKHGDSLVAVLKSTYTCATNLPLRAPAQIITVHDLPELTVQKDTTVCNGESVQLSVQTTATAFAWKPDPTLSSTTVQQPVATPGNNTVKTYILTATDNNGCGATDTLTVRTAPKVEIATSLRLTNPADTSICAGKLVQMVSDFSPSGNPIVRRWFKNGFATTDTGYMVNTSVLRDGDVYQLQITQPSLNTCVSKTAVSDAIRFSVSLPVQTKISANDNSVCSGDSILLTALGGAHHRWTTDDPQVNNSTETSVFVKPNTTTIYYLQAFDSRSLCSSRDSITIAVEPAIEVKNDIRLDERTPNCANADNVYRFEALPTNGGKTPMFYWYINGIRTYQTGNTEFGVKLNPGDQIYCEMHASADVVTCRSTIAISSTITILERPQTPIVDGHVLCTDSVATLVVQTPQTDVTYLWYRADDLTSPIGEGSTLNNRREGQYAVLAVASNNCESLETTYVDVIQGLMPQAGIRLITTDVQARETVEFANESNGWSRAFWYFGNNPATENNSLIVSYVFSDIGTYSVVLVVESIDGCTDTAQLQLRISLQLSGIYVPSAFMPSSPHSEDRVLKAYGEDIVSLKFTVYSLAGQELFTTTNPAQGWDGRYQGRDMPTGNYSYLVVAKLASGEEIVKTGTATLIR